MQIHVGITTRLGASRFPGKPLAKIAGRTMLEQENKSIAASASGYEAQVMMTEPGILRPGLRVAGAANSMKIPDEDTLVIVQGDEPLVHPEMIEAAVSEILANKGFNLGTLVWLANEKEFNDKNELKVVFNDENQIL